MKKTHKLLRKLREKNNYRQDYIAKYLGTTQQTYSNYELGIREIPMHHVVKLSCLYQVSVDYLLGIRSSYAGATDLTQKFLDDISLRDILFDIQNLDSEKRKSLIQFVQFLNSLN